MNHAPNAAPGPLSTRARLVVWGGAALLLLAPLVAMRFTDEVAWTAGDFAAAAVLLFGPLALYEWAARKTGDRAYRAGVAVALAGAFAIVWGSGAVGITDSPADGLYLLSLAVGAAGAVVARGRAGAMVRTMLATALGVLLAGAATVAFGMAAPTASPAEVAALTGVFAALFVGSALLFRRAARRAMTG